MNHSTPTTLYRLFDTEGALLYVGIAGNPGRRFEQHAKDKPWWSEVDQIDLEHMDTRAEALIEEAKAIREESPRYNVVHNLPSGKRPPSRDRLVGLVAEVLDSHPRAWGRSPTWGQAEAAAGLAVDLLLPYITGLPDTTLRVPVPAKPQELRWVCDGCRQEALFGYIEVDHNEIGRFQHAKAKWEQAHPGMVSIDELIEYPDPARWRVWHPDCDPNPEGGSTYSIEVRRLRTFADLVDWTAHLMEKNWLVYTNWDDLLRSLHSAAPPAPERQDITSRFRAYTPDGAA